jgi:hypothetical protein
MWRSSHCSAAPLTGGFCPPPPAAHPPRLPATPLKQLYPPAMRPSSQQILGYGAWGGVVGAVLFYAIQPFDWIKSNLGQEEKK